jgi:hypothetical protein
VAESLRFGGVASSSHPTSVLALGPVLASHHTKVELIDIAVARLLFKALQLSLLGIVVFCAERVILLKLEGSSQLAGGSIGTLQSVPIETPI